MPSFDNVDGAFCWTDGDSTSIIISVIVDTSGLGPIESERLSKLEVKFEFSPVEFERLLTCIEVKFEFSPVEFETTFSLLIGTTS